MHTHGTKFDRQKWWREADRYLSWRSAFNGQPTSALPSMPYLYCVIWTLACWLCGKFLTVERIDAHSWNKVLRTEVMERIWYIDTKVGGVHTTDNRLQLSQVCLYCVIWALVCWWFYKILNHERIDAHFVHLHVTRYLVWAIEYLACRIRSVLRRLNIFVVGFGIIGKEECVWVYHWRR